MSINRFLAIVARNKDIALVVVFALVLLMIILPLPTILMDILITLNISASIVIILISLQLHTSVQFSTFPSLLLITTLFRLAISISTTRLILTEGNAGAIVETFGQVVVGGNLIVGLVIFLIITVVQFLVITKGADRVAEVGARFTLDGMPGKQMSIDADVRAGNMDQIDAQQARQTLEREAKLFGSMDGAMKFVKGDATAGLVITAINLIGGIAIGMAQRGLGFGEALQLYALMTVGDGLVSQIPALLISVSAGSMVTRVANPRGVDLGTEISEQVGTNGRTIIIAGTLIALFGLVPGFPTAIFMLAGGSLVGGIIWRGHRQAKQEVATTRDWHMMQKEIAKQIADNEMRTGEKETVTLLLPQAVLAYDTIVFIGTFDNIRSSMEAEFGMPVGHWKFEIDEASATEYRIFIKQEFAASGHMRSDMVFVKANPSYLKALDIPFLSDFGAREGVLVAAEHAPRLKAEGIHYWPALEQMFRHLKVAITERLHALANLQSTFNLLNQVERSNRVLVRDLQEAVSSNIIASVLRILLKDRLPVTSHVRILETILLWSGKSQDAAYIAQKVRIALAEFITKRFAPDGFLTVVVVSPTLESYLREGVRRTEEGNFLVLAPGISSYVAEQVKAIIGESYRRGHHPVLITQQDVRYALFNVLQEHGLYIPVLAYAEIVPDTVIYPVGVLVPEGESEAA